MIYRKRERERQLENERDIVKNIHTVKENCEEEDELTEIKLLNRQKINIE